MGEALSVGIGLASARDDLSVVVIDGDGNALMGMSSWNLIKPSNLKYYILKNGTFCTTGSQKLPEFEFIPQWCEVIEIEDGKEDTSNPILPNKILQNTTKWLKELKNGK